MTTISKAVYKKLCDESVKLYKANETIDKLKEVIAQKTNEIKKLKERKIRKFSDVSGLNTLFTIVSDCLLCSLWPFMAPYLFSEETVCFRDFGLFGRWQAK